MTSLQPTILDTWGTRDTRAAIWGLVDTVQLWGRWDPITWPQLLVEPPILCLLLGLSLHLLRAIPLTPPPSVVEETFQRDVATITRPSATGHRPPEVHLARTFPTVPSVVGAGTPLTTSATPCKAPQDILATADTPIQPTKVRPPKATPTLLLGPENRDGTSLPLLLGEIQLKPKLKILMLIASTRVVSRSR